MKNLTEKIDFYGVPINEDASELEGMNRNQAEKILRQIFDLHTKGIHRDDHWKPLQDIFHELEKRNIPFEILQSEYYKNKGSDAIYDGKNWRINIHLTDKSGWRVFVQASFGPSPVGETTAYDLSYNLNWTANLSEGAVEEDATQLQHRIDAYQKEIESLQKTMASHERDSAAWKQAEFRVSNRLDNIKKLKAQMARMSG
jgi:hypothetical protein